MSSGFAADFAEGRSSSQVRPDRTNRKCNAYGGASHSDIIHSLMSQSRRPFSSADRTFRVDTEHHLVEMMASALKHMNRAIHVELREEAVLLQGSVDSWAEKQEAQEAIRQMTGSRMIHNCLDVGAF